MFQVIHQSQARAVSGWSYLAEDGEIFGAFVDAATPVPLHVWVATTEYTKILIDVVSFVWIETLWRRPKCSFLPTEDQLTLVSLTVECIQWVISLWRYTVSLEYTFGVYIHHRCKILHDGSCQLKQLTIQSIYCIFHCISDEKQKLIKRLMLVKSSFCRSDCVLKHASKHLLARVTDKTVSNKIESFIKCQTFLKVLLNFDVFSLFSLKFDGVL